MKIWVISLSLLLILSMIVGFTVSCSSSTPAPSSATPAAPTSAAAAQPAAAPAGTILKLAVFIPPGDPMVAGLDPWVKSFNDAAKGKYVMQVFPGGTLVGTNDVLDAVRLGAVEIGHGSIPTFAGHDPAFSAAEIPYLLDTYEANTEFVQLAKDYQDQIMQKKFNQKLLATWSMGYNEVYTTKKPIQTMADLKGLNLAVTAPLMAKSAQALGASPVTMDFPEEFPALQKGVVDGGMACAGGALSFMKYYEAIKYLIRSSRQGGELDVSINLDVWNKLGPDLQKAMQDGATAYATAMVPAMKKFGDDAMVDLKNHGVTIYDLPANERAKWKDACAQIATDYYNQVGPDTAKMIQGWAAKANADHPYGK